MFKNKKLVLSFLIIIMALTVSACSSNGSDNNSNNDNKTSGIKVEYLGKKLENPQASLYFFWGNNCPHCACEKIFLKEMKEKYPELEIRMYETWKNRANASALRDMAKAYGTTARGVPMTFIGDFDPWIGFSSRMGLEIEEKIEYCLENECIDFTSKL